jgi:glycosyltransferase involved in cell wall biosynthesis
MNTSSTEGNGLDPLLDRRLDESCSAQGTEPLAEQDSYESRPAASVAWTPLPNGTGKHHEPTAILALFCYEDPASPIGQQAGRLAQALAQRDTPVHLFARRAYEFYDAAVHVHPLGECTAGSLLEQVEEFNRRAVHAFSRQFPGSADKVTLLGYEWSAVPALSLLHSQRTLPVLLSLHSLERQRSDLSSELSRRIEALEAEGLRTARSVLFHENKVAEAARSLAPECGERLVASRWIFPADQFQRALDQGAIKARFQIGPVAPTILFVGDMDERHGPDVLMKAIPPVLKNHRQARFILVGEGALTWPMRVHSRYLLLDHAVCIPGSVEGQALCELVQAAEFIIVPSREQTEWWPVLAGWAAGRPVIASHEMAPSLGLRHEQDCVLVYPNPGSCVWGIERLLYDSELGKALAAEGRRTLEERFGWGSVAAQVQQLMGVSLIGR